jgi:mannose-1-phosphate guanylyltransferase
LFLRRSLALVLAALEVSAPGNTRKGAAMSESLERLARNQALFRAVNERIETIAGDNEAVEFVCECSNTDCADTIKLNLGEYERIRSNATWFVIRSDHDISQIERVISQDDGYAVVEKLVGVQYMEVTDPRSDEAHA